MSYNSVERISPPGSHSRSHTSLRIRQSKLRSPGGSVRIISGPNENSQKASISVNVLAANSQDEVYERTTRPRPESDKQTRILDDEMNDIETEEKSITLRYWRQESNQSKTWCPSVHSEAGIVAPKQEATLRLRTSAQK